MNTKKDDSYISKRAAELKESATLAMSQKTRELKSKGIDVINLSIGEPDFFVPNFIKEAAKQAIDDNYSFYPPVAGYPELRQMISHKLKRDNKLDYEPSQVVVSNGAKHAIANIFLAIINEGDEVLIPAPYWVSYPPLVQLSQGVPVYINSTFDNDFRITAEDIERHITPKTKAFIFSSPNNPSGKVYSYEELKEWAEVFAKYPQILIISDEIYELINFKDKHHSIAEFEEIRDRVIIVNGLSKGFAMTGWRVGYSVSPKNIAKTIEKIQGQMTSGINDIGQMAALKALSVDPEDCHELIEMRESFRKRRDFMLEALSEIPFMIPNNPDGAFYIFPKITDLIGKSYEDTKINDSNDLAMYLLNTANVALTSGISFGSKECIRLSYATSKLQLEKAAERIKKAINLLK
ncbi:MAG: pyridoxal phosphate-dependent aminotransferase [Bacteroidales bacterium]|jgi:aspartate aminotransferase|nr:pyridoxal phosphate-dependent aminotransferase [Bacteroidales bacterium]MDI9576246.1 pyridoxal phosphate-dependent aminotransferase [Bacteroidota bacterium]MDY0401102.1 pyridoxal phosphate-dependent aminotransferase [Bacteroidales bacterium]HHW59901.1 pyridoxal phosphate-dependent aminotransferase [Bacteroidales bacterium]HOB78153.1 pyridoxal phosphate-dependent aminotransferase [Bacteroidales bacterium]